MLKLKLILGFVILLFCNVQASKSHINVNFPGAENQKATIWSYRDLISLDRVVIAEENIDSNGNFSFDTYNNNVQMFYVEVRYFRISFYIKPKTNYQVNINKTDFNNRDFYPQNVVGYLSPDFKITQPSEDELNANLDSLNRIIDIFVQENHLALRMGEQSWKLVDSLQANINAFTAKHNDSYLKDYAEIQLVQFRMLSNQYGNDYVVETYFNPKKIKYQSQAYMTFFTSFWTKYVTTKVPQNIRKRLDSVVNITRSYQALSALLAEDSLLQNPALRELVILRNIPQMYQMKRFDKQAIINILYDISASKYGLENKQIAVNLRKKLHALDTGNKAPDFEFYDNNSDTLNLQILAGKYIYIQLWDDKCIECLSQMKYTKELYEKFDDIITFIHISLDRNSADMMQQIENKDYNWHFVFLEDNYQFIQDYQIGVLPRAILIDKEGNLVSWDARLPNNYFEDFFLQMLNTKKNNLDVKTKMRNGTR